MLKTYCVTMHTLLVGLERLQGLNIEHNFAFCLLKGCPASFISLYWAMFSKGRFLVS